MIRLLLECASGLLNLNSVMLGMFAFDRRAIHCYERVGFKEVGKRRQVRGECMRDKSRSGWPSRTDL